MKVEVVIIQGSNFRKTFEYQQGALNKFINVTELL